MNINEIQSMWKEDSFIDPDNLHLESLKIPQLHSKYYEIFNNILLLKKKSLEEKNKIKLKKYEYYTGKAEPEEYKEIYQKKIRDKEHLQNCMNADEDISNASLKIEYYDAMLNYLSDILKMIHSRTYQVKNSIEYQKYISGYG
jgi:antirestriction protein